MGRDTSDDRNVSSLSFCTRRSGILMSGLAASTMLTEARSRRAFGGDRFGSVI